MLKSAFAATVLAIIGFLAYAASRPNTFHGERSLSIRAPAEKIFPLINNFHQWEAWTPFNKDPAMKRTYSGQPSGEGARYAWEGNKDAGRGDIAITHSVVPHSVVFDLHMVAPFEGRNVGAIHLHPRADSTTVTWRVDDQHTLVLKVISWLINLDQRIGSDFELGLARLKSVAERG